MANGTGQSKAAYIIICSGRIDVEAATTSVLRLKAASDTARNLVVFYGDKVTEADTLPISELQHEMMENMRKWGNAKAHTKVAEMFELLDALEDKFEGEYQH